MSAGCVTLVFHATHLHQVKSWHSELASLASEHSRQDALIAYYFVVEF